MTGDVSGLPSFFLSVLFISSLFSPGLWQFFHLNIASLCVSRLYCLYIVACSPTSNINGHNKPGTCLISTRYYLLLTYVLLFAAGVMPPNCVLADLWESNTQFQSNNTSSTMYINTQTTCWEDACNCRALGGRAQCGPDMR